MPRSDERRPPGTRWSRRPWRPGTAITSRPLDELTVSPFDRSLKNAPVHRAPGDVGRRHGRAL